MKLKNRERQIRSVITPDVIYRGNGIEGFFQPVIDSFEQQERERQEQRESPVASEETGGTNKNKSV